MEKMESRMKWKSWINGGMAQWNGGTNSGGNGGRPDDWKDEWWREWPARWKEWRVAGGVEGVESGRRLSHTAAG